MSDPKDQATQETALRDVERRTIQEAMSGRLSALAQERFEEKRAEEKTARTKRLHVAQERRKGVARASRARRIQVDQEAVSKAQSQISLAVRSLRAAIRILSDAPKSPIPTELRERLRMIRNLEEAAGSVRRASRGDSYNQGSDADLDVDGELSAR